eukprot:scaffold58000_cov30-Attheya_sp.AAC.1
MKISTLTLLATIGSASGFVVSPIRTLRPSVSLAAGGSASSETTNNNNDEVVLDRRSLLQSIGAAAFVVASLPVPPASAGLLDDFGSDPTKINQVTKADPITKGAAKSESNMEPNLRSNYYYPTNKKRYLPRIKKCNDAIPEAAAMIGEANWEGANEFAIKIADDTILPMKLYTSSLLGGGTNVKVSFAKDMSKAADDFEKSQKKLVTAIKKKDQTGSSTALETMASALLTYRTAGRLLGPDGGGDIPSVDEIRRSACRAQGRSFEQKIKT